MKYAITLVIGLLVASCAHSEIGRWAQMQSAYNQTVKALTTGVNTGVIDLEQAETIEIVRAIAAHNLHNSRICINSTPGRCGNYLDAVSEALEQLSLYLGGA